MRYFHTFDALRFFAFFIVFIHHLPTNKNGIINFFTHSGVIGVQIFFVLSGFLISYILLDEKKKSRKINLKNFFIRRVLRIWPLYYIMILFAFITPFILKMLSLNSSDEGYYPNWIYPLLFLENYEMMIKDNFANVSPLRVMWSLCIEEHFYLLWGITFFFISNKKFPIFLIISILLSLGFRILYKTLDISYLDINTNVLYFSFGGIVAYLLTYKQEVIDKLSKISIIFKIIISSIFILLYFSLPHLQIDNIVLQPLIVGSVTAILIAFTLCSVNYLKISDKNIFSKLGKFTYGMYLFHTIWINLIVKFISDFTMIFVLSLFTTAMSSILSYYLFENQFLKLKKYFK